LLTVVFFSTTFSQTVNWASLLKDQRHVASVLFGAEYGVIYGVAYGYHLKSPLPLLLTVEHTQPAGGRLTDDFKDKLGIQARVLQAGDFQVSVRANGIFRRYESKLVRALNFGSDFSGAVGYYKALWFMAGEFGFDKAIVSNFRHKAAYLESFPEAEGGWYQPASGGNFYYGLKVARSFGYNDITLDVGKVINEDFETTPMLPFYLKLGYNRRF